MQRLLLFTLALGAALGLSFMTTPGAHAQVCDESGAYLYPEARTNYGLGDESYRNEDYCTALPYLRWIVRNEPLYTSQGDPDDRNFRRLAETYEGLANQAEDAQTRRTYLDSVLVVREQMVETMAANNIPVDERSQMIWQARFYAQYSDVYPEQQDSLYDRYLAIYRLAPDSTDDYYLNEIGRIASSRAFGEQMDSEEARDLVDELLPYADDPTYLQQIRDSFVVDPIDQWAYLLELYQDGDRSAEIIAPLFTQTVQLDTLIAELRPDFDRRALRSELLPLVAELNPSPEVLSFLGVQAFNEGRTDEGRGYFERAVEMSETNAQKANLYYRMANTFFADGQRAEAYRIAGQALEYDANFGPALYIRALVVAGTIERGSVELQAGAWCVADLFSRAAAAGGPTAEQARRQAGRYAASGPSSEQYFFLNWRPGQRITTRTGYGSCTTTVR